MIAVQTLWTKPMTKEELLRDFPLTVLSIKSISNFYETHVVTDSIGYELLSQVEFPGNVHIYNELDNYKYDGRLWAASKYYTYEKFAGSDFIHFDTDIVLEKKLIPSKSHLFDCYESKFFLNNLMFINSNVKRVFKDLGLNDLVYFDKSYNVGTFYFKDKAMRTSYVSQGKFILDLIQQKIDNGEVPEHFSKEDGGICMIYTEQNILGNYVDDNDVEFVRDSKYFQRLDNFCSIDQLNIKEFEQDQGVSLGEVNNFDYCNLLKVNSTGYTHLFSFLRKNELVQKQVDFYLKKYYPELYSTVQQILKTNNEDNQ